MTLGESPGGMYTSITPLINAMLNGYVRKLASLKKNQEIVK
jgi:hypothetical protein